MKKKLHKEKWIQQGFILQTDQDKYILGQGPFSYSSSPQAQALYRPDFFLRESKHWVKPSFLWETDKLGLLHFLFDELDFIIKEDQLEKNQFDRQTLEHIKQQRLKFLKAESDLNNRRIDLSNSLIRAFKRLKAKDDLNTFNKSCHHFKKSEAPSFIVYQEIFFQIQKAIREKQFQKAVPVMCESFELKSDRLSLIQKLFLNTGSLQGFFYGFWDKGKGSLGFTPEFLFKRKQSHFWTMALAGTGSSSGANLLKDKKELKEHQLVVQSLEEDLKDFVQWDRKTQYEMFFPPLKHIRSDLRGKMKKHISFEKLCLLLHPTPALGGYPAKQAFDWLKNYEKQKESRYFGAPFGFFNFETAFCLVALRALQWDKNRAWIYAGGGLIKESCLQKEWRELSLKRQQVKSFFQ